MKTGEGDRTTTQTNNTKGNTIHVGLKHVHIQDIQNTVRNRGHKQSSFQRKECRLLQPLLPCTQKRRELSAYIRSTCVKQSTHAATVQDVDPTPACAVHKAKRLVYHDRLKRRKFTRSDPPQTSEISEVCIRRNSVPIQRTPVRLSSGAEGIHKVRRSSHRPI